MSPFRSGYIAIIGRPNVGKSTLLNNLLGQKLAAVSSKPQTTRSRILGIKHVPGAQLLFLDTPGIHKPHKSLNDYMVEVAQSTFDDADIFILVIEPEKEISRGDRTLFEAVSSRGKPVIVVINKADRGNKLRILPLMDQCLNELKAAVVVPLSALKGDGVDGLEQEILKRLPEGPAYYPEDQVTDQTERNLASEIIREKVFELTRQEVPYSVAVVIESFQEPKEGDPKPIIRIRAAIIVEKDSQKGIVIGKKGQMAKKIGEDSRHELERELGNKVFLELFVRVEKDWTKDPRKVREFLEPAGT